MSHTEEKQRPRQPQQPQQPRPQSSDSKTISALTHILGLVTWIGPIIVYFMTDDPFVKRNAANATNWQISFALWMVISMILSLAFIGFLGLLILPILDLAFCVAAAAKASDGETWDYPATIDIL